MPAIGTYVHIFSNLLGNVFGFDHVQGGFYL